jgi:hypothetical protein
VNITGVTAVTTGGDVRHRAASGLRGIPIPARQNSFCREAEMIDLKKKCWREKVTAEITLAHLQQFAHELGTNMNAAEVAAFLNEKGRAQDVWMHMMQAGEDFIKSRLTSRSIGLHSRDRSAAELRSLQ